MKYNITRMEYHVFGENIFLFNIYINFSKSVDEPIRLWLVLLCRLSIYTVLHVNSKAPEGF